MFGYSKLDSFEKPLAKELIRTYSLILIPLAIVVLTMFGVLRPQCEIHSVWFQRSGSIAVVMAIFAEVSLIKHDDPNAVYLELATRDRFKACINNAHSFVFALAVLGTIVWGYGDIIHLLIFSNEALPATCS